MPNLERRIVSVDALRGIAALAVVFWHWQHFWPRGTVTNDLLPAFSLFWPFYTYGYLGVDLFFCISGFVFFTIYTDQVASGSVSAIRFAILRFSRLYPLHFVTLIAVAVLQSVYYANQSHFFVNTENTPAYFLLQLFLASNWLSSSGSFNGPIWSVSIEALLYVFFFCVAKFRLTHPFFLAALSICGFLLINSNGFLGRGLFSFYLGCLCAVVVKRLSTDRSLSLVQIAAIVAVPCFAFVWNGQALASVPVDAWMVVIVFPALVIALALADDALTPVTCRLRWLGDISYSSYLLHFPLQLCVVTSLALTGGTVDFSSPLTLAAFFASLIFLSLLSYRYFERPVMQWLRMRLQSPAVAQVA
jgi:peptidoglycan/LPS O-acetylase OafA/YrhL